MSGLRISEFKKPRSIVVDQARVDSAYGPKSSIQLESTATSYSKSGFTIEVKGLSRDSLMSGIFVVIPIQMRWRNCLAANLWPNGYPDKGGAPITANNKYALGADYFDYDDISIRPNAFKCIRNATLSINGSSFSTRVDSYYTALCKLFADGRVEDISGAKYETHPYSSTSSDLALQTQDGVEQRAMGLQRRGRVSAVVYSAVGKISDIVWQYDVKFPLWFGPFTHLGFPGLSGFDGQSVSSFPYVSDLVLECTFTEDPLMDMFVCSDNSDQNAFSVRNPSGQANTAVAGSGPDTRTMWESVTTADAGIASLDKDTKFVGLRQPKLCYSFAEPDSDKMSLAPIYTLPSYRLITYEDRKVISSVDLAGNNRSQTCTIEFPYIRLSNISALYICFAEDDRVDQGNNHIAARSSKNAAAGYSKHRRGMATSSWTCPIKWDTVKVQMSTSSSVLSNFVNNTVTPQRQYELFKKYSGNAMALSYEDWLESSQMLLFSAEELNGVGAFANSYQSLTLSVSFDVYRTAPDTKVTPVDFTAAQNDGTPYKRPSIVDPTKPQKGEDIARAIIGRLVCLEPELVSISEGALSVEQVKLSQQEIQAQLMGGAPEVEDANKLDELAR